MELPKIEVEEVVVPPVEEKVYDKGWLTELLVTSGNPQATRVYAVVRPSRTLDDGTTEVLVQNGTEKVVDIQNLFGLLNGTVVDEKLTPETLQKLGQAMYLVLDAINSYIADKNAPDSVVEPVATLNEETQPNN